MERLDNFNLLSRLRIEIVQRGPGDVNPEDLELIDHNGPHPEPTPTPGSSGPDDGDSLG